MATGLIVISSIVSGVGDLRIGSAYTFFIARGADKKSLTGAYLLFRLGTFSAGSLIILAVGIWQNWFPGYLWAFVLFMLVPILEIPEGIYSTLRVAEGRTALGQVPYLVEGTVRMGIIVFFALQFTVSSVTTASGGVSSHGMQLVADIAIAYFIGALASIFVSLPFFKYVSLGKAKAALRDMFVFALPLMGAMLLTYSVSMITPIIVWRLSSSSVLQVYSAVNAFLLLLIMVPSAICTPLFPDLARMHVKGETKELENRVRKSVRFTLMLLAPGILALATFRVDFLQLFYTYAYVPLGAAAMVIIVFSAVPQTLFRITGTALDSAGYQKREFYVSSMQLAVLLVALFILVHQYEVVGAAIALLLSSIAALAMNVYFMHKYLPINLHIRSMVTVLLASALTFTLFSSTFLGFFQISLAVNHWNILIGVVIAGFALYGAMLALLGELTKADVMELSSSVGLPSLGRLVSKLCWKDSQPED
jgi:O-antigen/teichoic acid export membrane protein